MAADFARPMFTAIIYVLVSWHFWACRSHVATARHWLQEAVREWRRGRRVPSSAGIQQRMDKVRIEQYRFLLKWGARLLGPALIFLNCRLGDDAGELRHLAFLTALYALCLGAVTIEFELLRRHVNILYVIVSLGAMWRYAFTVDPTPFHILAGPRTLMRAILGIGLMDVKISLCMNAITSLHLCWKYSEIDDTGTNTVTMFTIEGFTFGALALLFFLIEKSLESSARASLDMQASQNTQQAVRTLLSVLCDAEVHLGPDLRLIEPSKKANHLFAANLGVDASASFAGTEFVDLVACSDRQRFLDFIRMSSGQAYARWDAARGGDVGPAQCVDGHAGAAPAASLHLHLRAATGTRPVELFHARLPDVDNHLGHLLGIRDTGVLPCRDAAEASGPQAHAVSPSHRAETASVVDAQETQSVSESSSRSTSSMPLSPSELQRMGLPELASIEVLADALDERMEVHEVTLRFLGSSDAATAPLQPPQFADWIHEQSWRSFHDWVQEEVNAAFNGHSTPGNFGSVLMQWPSHSGSTEELLLEAEAATLELHDDQDLEELEEDSALLALVTLTGFSQFNGSSARSLRRRRPRRHARARQYQVQHLPCIEEASGEVSHVGGSSESRGSRGSKGSSAESPHGSPDASPMTIDSAVSPVTDLSGSRGDGSSSRGARGHGGAGASACPQKQAPPKAGPEEPQSS